jgi:hypothetical protein
LIMSKEGHHAMNDKEFETLKENLETTHDAHEHLQRVYKELTGRRWIPPLRLPSSKKLPDTERQMR